MIGTAVALLDLRATSLIRSEDPPVSLSVELPDLPAGVVAILSTGAGRPHAIPVSTVVAAGEGRLLLALARRRESLARLREDPRCALTVLAAGDVAFTAHARAVVVEEPMTVSDRVAAVLLEVEAVQDHRQPRFEILEGVRWRWTDPEADARDAEIRDALLELAGRLDSRPE